MIKLLLVVVTLVSLTARALPVKASGPDGASSIWFRLHLFGLYLEAIRDINLHAGVD